MQIDYTTRRQRPAISDFFPQDPALLIKSINYYTKDNYNLPQPKALIVPHAAYHYSGAIAGKAYAALKPHAHAIKTVLLIAPSHYQWLEKPLTSDQNQIETPPGSIQNAYSPSNDAELNVDKQIIQQEYAIQVQLPFIKTILPDSTVKPVLASEESTILNKLIQSACSAPQTLIIISSDLYHYLPSDYAVFYGRRISNWVEQQQISSIGPEEACGYMAIRPLLKQIKLRQGHVITLALQHSGNTRQIPIYLDEVVGYGAYLIYV